MKIEDIRQLVDLMVANDLTELNITDGDAKVSLKRGAEVVPAAAPIAAAPAAPSAPPAAPSAEPAPAENLREIRSPMVGTFYTASSPDSDPFVAVGEVVSDETVVCVLEAMKVMNEIKAECSGTVAEICVRNAQPVEFGQVLFRVKPA